MKVGKILWMFILNTSGIKLIGIMMKNAFKPYEVVAMWFDKLNIPGRKKPLKLYHRIVLFFILALTVVLTISFLMVFFFSQQLILNESEATMVRFNDYVVNTIEENSPLLLSLTGDERLKVISEKLYPYVKDNSLIAYRLSDNGGHIYQSSELL